MAVLLISLFVLQSEGLAFHDVLYVLIVYIIGNTDDHRSERICKRELGFYYLYSTSRCTHHHE